jgi:hypothetical protein
MTQKFANAARAYLASTVSDSATTVTIDGGGSLFPAITSPEFSRAVLQDANGIEVVLITAHTAGSDTFTVTRGQEGTTARSFAAGSVFGIRMTSADGDTFVAKQNALVSGTNIKTVNSSSLLGSGDLAVGDVTLSGTQTLTNKTITGGTVNPTTLQEGGVAAVVQTDIGTAPNEIPLNQYLGSAAYVDINSFVTPAGTQTLTNKTIAYADNTLTGVAGTTATQTLTDKTIEAGTFTNGYTEEVATANTSTAYTIDLTNGSVQILTLTGNCTYTFPTATAGKSFILIQKQDGTGSRTVTWPASVKWPGGTAPTLTSTASKADKFIFTADGTNWLGSNAGQNYTV